MARKQMFEGGTKNRIIEVGNRLFFEKGFDGTGIREIMKEVGADVGKADPQKVQRQNNHRA